MRPPLRSTRHTKNPRADHNTACLTSIAPPGSIAAHRSPSRDAGAGFDTATNGDPCDPRWHRNKDGARHLSWRTAILSPSPRAWPFNVGRSRYADRLRPNFLLKASDIASAKRCPTATVDVLMRCELLADAGQDRGRISEITTTATASLGARSACARAGALCVRKTVPG
jgi:hypothetical protein